MKIQHIQSGWCWKTPLEIICQLAEGVLHLTVQVTNDDVKQALNSESALGTLHQGLLSSLTSLQWPQSFLSPSTHPVFSALPCVHFISLSTRMDRMQSWMPYQSKQHPWLLAHPSSWSLKAFTSAKHNLPCIKTHADYSQSPWCLPNVWKWLPGGCDPSHFQWSRWEWWGM